MTMFPAFLAFLVPLAGIAAAVYVTIRFLDYLRLRATACGDAPDADAPGLAAVNQRLEEIDRRLNEVQDVMIALSEKFDRWETEQASWHNS